MALWHILWWEGSRSPGAGQLEVCLQRVQTQARSANRKGSSACMRLKIDQTTGAPAQYSIAPCITKWYCLCCKKYTRQASELTLTTNFAELGKGGQRRLDMG